MADNPNYWKFKGTIKKLEEKENNCFICGSEKNIVPHHIKKVKQSHADYYSEDNLVLLCDYHHHKYHKEYPNVNLKTFCEFFRENFMLKIKESELDNVNKKRRLNMDIDLSKPLKISKLIRFIKLVNKTPKKTVRISIDETLYGIRNVRAQQDYTILGIRDYKEGLTFPNYENDNFVIHIDYGDELRLSKFRKIIKLVSGKNVLKVSVNEELYNIIQIKDRKDAMIFVVDFKETQDTNKISDNTKNNTRMQSTV